MAVYVIVGVPGAGKSYVLGKALEKIRGKYKVLTFGTMLFEAAQEKGLVDDRDKLRYLPKETTDQLRLAVAKKIASEKENVILDTHAAMRTDKGYAPGLPKDVLDAIRPKAIIIVEGRPEDIAARREKDQKSGARNRSDFGGARDVEEWQSLNRSFVASYCAMSGANLAIVLNEQGMADAAAEKMRGVLE